jgi:hypothetical protein
VRIDPEVSLATLIDTEAKNCMNQKIGTVVALNGGQPFG